MITPANIDGNGSTGAGELLDVYFVTSLEKGLHHGSGFDKCHRTVVGRKWQNAIDAEADSQSFELSRWQMTSKSLAVEGWLMVPTCTVVGYRVDRTDAHNCDLADVSL